MISCLVFFLNKSHLNLKFSTHYTVIHLSHIKPDCVFKKNTSLNVHLIAVTKNTSINHKKKKMVPKTCITTIKFYQPLISLSLINCKTKLLIASPSSTGVHMYTRVLLNASLWASASTVHATIQRLLWWLIV